MKHISWLCVTALLMLAACDRSSTPPPPAAGPAPVLSIPADVTGNPAADARPSPDLSSLEVVRRQMLALQHADDPAPNAGIVIAFRFASPENKQMTGPIERFVGMVRTPGYEPMLGCESFDILESGEGVAQGPEGEAVDVAQHLVVVRPKSGGEMHYAFQLRKQSADAPEVGGCWMVDGVSLVPPGALPPEPATPAPSDTAVPI